MKKIMNRIKNFILKYKIAIGACALMAVFGFGYWVLGNPGITTIGEDVNVGSNLKVGGNIIDSADNIIYNDSAKEIERERLPFEQGDITSDVDTNTWDVGYYDVSNLIPGSVKTGVSYGRNQIGVFAGDIAAGTRSPAISDTGWTLCASFINTAGDDIDRTWDDGCENVNATAYKAHCYNTKYTSWYTYIWWNVPAYPADVFSGGTNTTYSQPLSDQDWYGISMTGQNYVGWPGVISNFYQGSSSIKQNSTGAMWIVDADSIDLNEAVYCGPTCGIIQGYRDQKYELYYK